jgi:hypothetical protein
MSKLFTLNNKDFLKGLVMAILISAITIIQQSLDKGTLVFDWKAIAIASISGALAYLMKNFFTSEARPLPPPIEYPLYTEEQTRAVEQCVFILEKVGLELLGTRPKDR